MAYFLSLQYCDSGSTYQGNKYTLQLRTSPWTSVEQATLCLPKGGCQEHKALLANHVRGTPCRGRTVTTRCREKCRSYRGGSLTWKLDFLNTTEPEAELCSLHWLWTVSFQVFPSSILNYQDTWQWTEDLCRCEGKEKNLFFPSQCPSLAACVLWATEEDLRSVTPRKPCLYKEKDELCSTLSVQTDERSVKILGHGRAAH